MKLMNSAIAAVGLAGIAAGASGVTIVDWNLQGQTGSQASVAVNSVAANITGATLARGAGLTGASGANSINASGWTGEATDYFSFGFTVDSGYSVDLSELAIGTRSSGTGPGTLGVFYSVDGYAAAIATFNQAPGANFVNTLVDLSSLANITGTVEFRVQAIGTTSAGGGTTGANGTARLTAYFTSGTFDRNLGLSGTVIPAPGSATLAALGIVAMGMRARRR